MNVTIILKLFITDVLLQLVLIAFILVNISKCNNFYLKYVVMVKIEIKINKLSDNSLLKDIQELNSKKKFLEIKYYHIIFI
jgi:hypothetical protein